MVRVAVFLQHYHTPDCPTAGRPHALVERLAREHEVSLFTTNAWEEKRLTDRFDWVPPGVRAHVFDVPYDNAMTARERLRSFLAYAWRAYGRGRCMSRPDVVIGSSTPLTAALAAAAVARGHDVPWIFEVRDLWPDFPVQMGAVPRPVRPFLYSLESALYRSAAHVVPASPDMARHVAACAPSTPATTIPYGTDRRLLPDEQPERVRDEFGIDSQHVVLYAGAFGRANAIPTLLAAARRLHDRDDLRFVFAGTGALTPRVRRAAGTEDRVLFLGPLPYPKALRLFAAASLSVVSFVDRPILAANAPSKFFDSLSVGTPVLVTQNGWARRFVNRHNCGAYVPPESPGALALRIRRLLQHPNRLRRAGRNGRQAAATHFDRSHHMDRYARLVRRIRQFSSS